MRSSLSLLSIAAAIAVPAFAQDREVERGRRIYAIDRDAHRH